ncbi:MAG: hypothetical protein ABR878_13715 [Roseiarcus sp.]|jgi:hypothetical protein
MRKFLFALALFGSLPLCNAPALGAGPLIRVDVGNWHGGSYTFDATGQFSHCAISASYTSGIIFFVAVSNDYTWRLGFSHPTWNLNIGSNIPVDLTFDGKGPYHLYARAQAPNFVVIEMPTTSEVVKRFRGAYQMTAFAIGQVYPLNLTDTSVALPALVDCVRHYVGAPPVQAVTNVPPASSSPPPGPTAAPEPAADLHEEAVELATNFLLGAKLDDPKVVSKSATPVAYASFGADWRASQALGSVKIVTGAGLKGLDVASAVVASDASACKGKFASARTSDMVDSDVIFRGFSSCEDSAGTRFVEYFIVPRKQGGFVLFSIAAIPGAASSSSEIDQTRINLFERAALTSVN